jgi:hypothetical protein
LLRTAAVAALLAWATAPAARAQTGPPAKADILFVVDTTGSMSGAIRAVQTDIADVMTRIGGGEIGDVAYGLAEVKDYPQASVGDPTDRPFRVLQAITGDTGALQSATGKLVASGGGDGPESYEAAVAKADAGEGVGWREGARRMLVLVADNVPHDDDLDEGIPEDDRTMPSPFNTKASPEGYDWQATLDAAREHGLPVLMVFFHGAGDYLTYWAHWAGRTAGSATDGNIGDLEDTIVSLVEDEADDTLPPCGSPGDVRDEAGACGPPQAPPTAAPAPVAAPSPVATPVPKPLKYNCKRTRTGSVRCTPPCRRSRAKASRAKRADCSVLVALGDSVTAGHNRDKPSDKATACQDRKYGYPQKVMDRFAKRKDLKEEYGDADYENFAISGYGTGQVLHGNNEGAEKGTTAAVDGCGVAHPDHLAKPPIELAREALKAHPRGKNVVVVSAGINNTNWVQLLAGVALDILPMTKLAPPDSVVVNEFIAAKCEELIERGSPGWAGKWNAYAGYDGAAKAPQMAADIKQIVKRLRAVDKDVIIVWVGYYNMANTGLTGPAGDFKLTLTEGVAVPKFEVDVAVPTGEIKWVPFEGHIPFSKKKVTWKEPRVVTEKQKVKFGGYDFLKVQTPVLNKRDEAMLPKPCWNAVDVRINRLHETITNALRPDPGTHTYFISPNRQDALFSNQEMLQPIFPAEVIADKRAEPKRLDRPPGWPHPNEKGAGAIADLIIGLEDKD